MNELLEGCRILPQTPVFVRTRCDVIILFSLEREGGLHWEIWVLNPILLRRSEIECRSRRYQAFDLKEGATFLSSHCCVEVYQYNESNSVFWFPRSAGTEYTKKQHNQQRFKKVWVKENVSVPQDLSLSMRARTGASEPWDEYHDVDVDGWRQGVGGRHDVKIKKEAWARTLMV